MVDCLKALKGLVHALFALPTPPPPLGLCCEWGGMRGGVVFRGVPRGDVVCGAVVCVVCGIVVSWDLGQKAL